MTNVSTIGNADLAHLLGKAHDAASRGPNGMSTGEQLAVALILDRPDWLAAMSCTIAEAMEKVGPDWLRLIPAAARQFRREQDETAYAAAEKARQAKLAQFIAQEAGDEKMDFSATLVTFGDAPGYREVRFTFDLEPIGEGPRTTIRTCISIRPEDGERIVSHIRDVHRFAWDRSGGRPIDAKPDEQRPSWIDGRYP
ncbi:hypothetical protein [Caballeronia sp. dw_19]|uniref:hypothetical protein n=1 Tax=Caballeronia sp. dw_19 TaxID=2719791 RepID=UPI001BD668DD|nr:hypothetical protein [Caballeronia sp. dw_19]